jgi:hypothetical protein
MLQGVVQFLELQSSGTCSCNIAGGGAVFWVSVWVCSNRFASLLMYWCIAGCTTGRWQGSEAMPEKDMSTAVHTPVLQLQEEMIFTGRIWMSSRFTNSEQPPLCLWTAGMLILFLSLADFPISICKQVEMRVLRLSTDILNYWSVVAILWYTDFSTQMFKLATTLMLINGNFYRLNLAVTNDRLQLSRYLYLFTERSYVNDFSVRSLPQ